MCSSFHTSVNANLLWSTTNSMILLLLILQIAPGFCLYTTMRAVAADHILLYRTLLTVLVLSLSADGCYITGCNLKMLGKRPASTKSTEPSRRIGSGSAEQPVVSDLSAIALTVIRQFLGNNTWEHTWHMCLWSVTYVCIVVLMFEAVMYVFVVSVGGCDAGVYKLWCMCL